MNFNDDRMQSSLVVWRQQNDPYYRAEADNFWFEQRVNESWQDVFETSAPSLVKFDDLRKWHSTYYTENITVDPSDVPDSFNKEYHSNDGVILEENQKIVRLESLARPLGKHGIDFPILRDAFGNGENEILEKFFQTWNNSNCRDGRPIFSTFGDVLTHDLAHSDWPDRVRDRLGLAHYDPGDGSIPVALMEYQMGEVYRFADRAGLEREHSVVAPTVLDSGPWPWFFPAPYKLPCGRTMSLVEVEDDSQLIPEILHLRIDYSRKHLMRVGEIKRPIGDIALGSLRNHHLLAVRIAADDTDFGEEMPEFT